MNHGVTLIWMAILLSVSATVKADLCETSYDVVISRTSEELHIPKSEIVASKSFSEQKTAGDDFAVLKIVLALEESLGIRISDEQLGEKIGSSGATELTVKALQEIAAEVCERSTIPGTAKSERCKTTDEVVISRISERLHIPKSEVAVSKPFSEQNPAGDDLAVLEILMAVEESLDIHIPDEELGDKIEQPSLMDLTIMDLHDLAVEVCENHKING